MRIKTAIALAALAATCQPAFARPAVVPYDVPGETSTVFVAINNAGVIAGNASDTTQHGVIRAADGTYTLIDVPGSRSTTINGINAAGDTVGFFNPTQGGYLCFIRTAEGTFTVFGSTTGRRSGCNAAAINDDQDVTGTVDKGQTHYGFLRLASGATRVFLKLVYARIYTNAISNKDIVIGFKPGVANQEGFLRTKHGTIITFDAPGDADGTFPRGINTKGSIAGSYADSSNVDHGFYRTADGTFATFDVPNAIDTFAVAINARDLIIGDYATGKITGGFVRTAQGIIHTFAPKGYPFVYPMAVNDEGVIVGYLIDKHNQYHGFVRTP